MIVGVWYAPCESRVMRLLGCFLSAMILVACAGSGDDSSDDSGSALSAPGSAICQPPPTLFRLTKPNADYYEVFPTDDAARAVVGPLLEAGGMKLSATPAPDAIRETVAKHFA